MRAITRVRLRVHLKALPQYLLVLANLAVTAWFTDRWLEAAIFAVAFLAFRYKFTDILHFKRAFHCILFSNALVFIAIPAILPITNTLFGGILCACAVNYFASLIASNIFRQSEKERLAELEYERRARDVYAMSEEDLRQYCKSLGFDEIDTEIVVQRLIYHLKGRDLYEKIGYSKRNMLRREANIEEILGVALK